jgi:hypothetical protein
MTYRQQLIETGVIPFDDRWKRFVSAWDGMLTKWSHSMQIALDPFGDYETYSFAGCQSTVMVLTKTSNVTVVFIRNALIFKSGLPFMLCGHCRYQ